MMPVARTMILTVNHHFAQRHMHRTSKLARPPGHTKGNTLAADCRIACGSKFHYRSSAIHPRRRAGRITLTQRIASPPLFVVHRLGSGIDT